VAVAVCGPSFGRRRLGPTCVFILRDLDRFWIALGYLDLDQPSSKWSRLHRLQHVPQWWFTHAFSTQVFLILPLRLLNVGEIVAVTHPGTHRRRHPVRLVQGLCFDVCGCLEQQVCADNIARGAPPSTTARFAPYGEELKTRLSKCA
jgi:hypothetical protein